MRAHKLKIWPETYKAVEREDKTCELRRTDRDYQVGDYLMLMEFVPVTDTMTFGKYKGQLVATVLRDHPDYALWAHENVSFFTITVSQIQDCVSRSVAGARGILPHSPSDNCGRGDEFNGMSYPDFGNN